MDLERWINIEGPKRLQESLRKLKLTKDSVRRKDFTTYTEDELVQEKKNVKNELKYYDSSFMTIFSKSPARADKEPMRPLYMYYQNLRKAITKKHNQKPTGNKNRGSSVGSMAASSEGNASRGSFASLQGGSDDERPSSASKQKVPFSDDEAKKLPTDELMGRLGIKNEQELKKMIFNDFIKERKHLRKVLDSFQKDFQKTYNRKLRFTKDIAPVASEFKRYKDLKKEIAKLETVLQRLKNARKDH